MYFLKYFLLFFVIRKCYTVHLQYVDLNEKRVNCNLTTVDINENVLKSKFFWLYLLKYEPDEDQIQTICNVTNLEHIDIYSVGQKLLPMFRNLPRIKHIAIKGNEIFYISNGALSHVPVQEIYLDNNHIETIENWSFGKSVNTLYVSCNKLKNFSPRWFTDTTVLKELDLSGNDITNLPENIFKPFIALNLIALSHNKITTIGQGAFSNRNSFWILYLDNNKLTQLPPEAFQKRKIKIYSMHIQYNRLTYLDKKFIRKTNTTKAKVQGNPWQCACFDIIKKWNVWDQLTPAKDLQSVPKCLPYPTNSHKCIQEVDLKFIEEYEKKYPPKETKIQFCKNYLK